MTQPASSMFADLHLHTHFSDGTFTPEELAAHARRHDLAAVALTDHDSVEGCERMAGACGQAGIEFVPGTELTAEHEGCELHLLGYFVATRHEPFLRELDRFQRSRQDRIREMVSRLNQRSIPLRPEVVFALANCSSPGRPHVARALVKEGFCGTLDEAFERFLKKHRPAWVPKARISAVDAVRLIHDAGGVAVMAHPGLNHNDQLIPVMVEAGVDGIECWHSRHSHSAVDHYLEVARRFELLVTGGSDCHGLSKGRPLIGTVKLAWEHYARLKEFAAGHRHAAGHSPLTPTP